MTKSLINDLHAGISRRDWYAVETAAIRLRDEIEKTTRVLAGTDIGSLPNDYPLSKLSEDLKDELVKANRDMDMYRDHGDRKSEQVIALQQSDRRMRAALAWVRANYASGPTQQINAHIDAALSSTSPTLPVGGSEDGQ